MQTAYLVIGQAQTNAVGQIEVSYQLFDVATQAQLQRVSFNIGREQWRDVGHKIADLVYTEVTGVRGAFSTKILYVLAQDIGTQSARYKLQIADVDGARARTLFDSSEPILSASWSPDGRRVAYVSFETGRPSIILQDIDGPNRERLTNFRGINGSPVFSPDGKQLAMVLSRSGDPEVFVMDLETRKLRRITRHPAIDTEPSWSPDGKVICVIDTLLQYQAGARAAHASRLLSPRCAHQRPRALPARGTPLLPLPKSQDPSSIDTDHLGDHVVHH